MIATPFEKLAEKLSQRLGKKVDLNKGWGIFLPIALKASLGNLPKNVFYSATEQKPFAAPLPPRYLTTAFSTISVN